MTISHHSHSGQFCLHAKGTLEEVVQTAIAKGFTTFGLTEHVPRSRTKDLYPEEVHLTPSDLSTTFQSYLIEAKRLQTKYRTQITLLIGLETESIHSTTLNELKDLLGPLEQTSTIQYLVGSVHHVLETPIDFDKETFDQLLESIPIVDSTKATHEARRHDQFDQLFQLYFDAQFELITTLEPEVMGHFDLCRLYYPEQRFKDYPPVWEKIERNVRKVIDYGGLFEVNASAFRKGWETAYPGVEVFELIQKLGGRFTLSDDSHGPQAVGLHYDRIYAYLQEMGFEQLWKLEPKDSPLGTEGGKVSRGVIAVPVKGKPWEDTWLRLL